jgi:hypothetical protein
MQLAGLEYPIKTFAHKHDAILQFFPEHRFPSSRFSPAIAAGNLFLNAGLVYRRRGGMKNRVHFSAAREMVRAWPNSRLT